MFLHTRTFTRRRSIRGKMRTARALQHLSAARRTHKKRSIPIQRVRKRARLIYRVPYMRHVFFEMSIHAAAPHSRAILLYICADVCRQRSA